MDARSHDQNKIGLCKVCIPGTKIALANMVSILCYMHCNILPIFLQGLVIIRV